jgi:hypothetical protein
VPEKKRSLSTYGNPRRFEQWLEPDHRIQCDVCRRVRRQHHFAVVYPYQKDADGRFYVKVCSRCKKCRRRCWLAKVKKGRREQVRSLVNKMNSAFSRCDSGLAYRWAAAYIRRVGGVARAADMAERYSKDSKVSPTARSHLLRAVENCYFRMESALIEAKIHFEQTYRDYYNLLTPAQRLEETIRRSKRILRDAGYRIMRRRPIDGAVRTERDTRPSIPGARLAVATIAHIDRQAVGDDIAIDVALRHLRDQFIAAARQQNGRNVRFHLLLTIEENRETLAYLLNESADEFTSESPPLTAPGSALLDSADRSDNTPSAG